MLGAPATALRSVGARLAERLQRLGIHRVRDLLFHLPSRYEDRTRLVAMNRLAAGEAALCQGVIEWVKVQPGRRRNLLCRLRDETGAVVLRFFHFSQAQQAGLRPGVVLRCWGQVRAGRRSLEMVHPECRRINPAAPVADLEQTLTPVYPATEGLSQFRLRDLAAQALAALNRDAAGLPELLPPAVAAQFDSLDLAAAVRFVHRPPRDADAGRLAEARHPAQQRLAFEELLAHHLSLRRARARVRERASFPVGDPEAKQVRAFLDSLPFELTAAQLRVLTEIRRDMQQSTPMLRLVQGDVGSGKTIVAAVAAMLVIQSGRQAALMAPTEILADQHCFNLRQWFAPVGIPVLLLTGKSSGAEKSQVLELLESGRPALMVGTHALFQEGVSFGAVGLVVIDEQHRFGVDQRLALLEKGMDGNRQPHQLVMTATPIPRTLAMALFADLDISVIDELPPGRKPVRTTVISNEKRAEVVRRIHAVCKQGRQAYWVCALIETSDASQLQAAEEVWRLLSAQLAGLGVGLIHGRMKSAEKEQVMNDFKAGDIDVLVATTVIEVGVDVPNAGLMIIENAERLGLSQLHQLRGRVGRGAHGGDCVLLYQAPLSQIARIRLSRMRETNDGFALAQSDLELRGPGEILGTRQTGLPAFRVADFARDAPLVPGVRQVADDILEQWPGHADKLIARWLSAKVEFGKV